MKTYIESEKEIAQEAGKWVARKARGLSPEEEAQFAEWMQGHDHAKAFRKYSAGWDMLGRELSPKKLCALKERVGQLDRKKRTKRAAIGSAVALLFIVGFVGWNVSRKPVHEPARSVMILPRHEILPDGTVVDAPAGAEYKVDYAGHFRRVHLGKGEALFTVAKDAERPFVVEAGGIEFRAVGTAFSVRMQTEKVSLLVTEGKVAVDRSSATAPLETPTTGLGIGNLGFVQAGQRVDVQRTETAVAAPVMPVDEHGIAERLAWRNPKVEFSGAPLSEVVALINRYSEVKFVIDDPVLEKMELSGVFPATDSAVFEKALVRTFGVEAEHRGKQVILRRFNR